MGRKSLADWKTIVEQQLGSGVFQGSWHSFLKFYAVSRVS
ncbi:MAG: hypothetical protein OFPII_12370 [Osedax symbiont Rs1]|nr:MAG: hypothetical protein OFPII_12370 [Osedax symbiont Rs1]